MLWKNFTSRPIRTALGMLVGFLVGGLAFAVTLLLSTDSREIGQAVLLSASNMLEATLSAIVAVLVAMVVFFSQESSKRRTWRETYQSLLEDLQRICTETSSMIAMGDFAGAKANLGVIARRTEKIEQFRDKREFDDYDLVLASREYERAGAFNPWPLQPDLTQPQTASDLQGRMSLTAEICGDAIAKLGDN